MRTVRKPEHLAPLAILLRDATGLPLDGGVITALRRDGVAVTRAKVGNFTAYYVPRAAFERWLAQRIAESAL
jgi:hypothetical protein